MGEKFISGMKEVIEHPGKKGHIYRPNSTFAEATNWIGHNEHLMGSAFHLLTVTSSYDFMDYDAVIQIEYLDRAYPEMLRRAPGLTDKQRKALAKAVLRAPAVNVKEKSATGTAAMHDPTKGRLPLDVFKGDWEAIK